MRIPATLLAGSIAAAIIAAAIVFWPIAKKSSPSAQVSLKSTYVFGEKGSGARHLVVNTDLFIPPQGVQKAITTRRDPQHCVSFRALMVNHHILAADLLSTMAEYVTRCRPETKRLIVISPDHFYAGTGSMTTALVSYQTESTIVKTSSSLSSSLLASVSNVVDESFPFKREHGIGAVIPFFVQDHSIEFVPILIKGRIIESDATALSAWLKETMQDSSNLVVISADMSHYLSKEETLKNDEQTIKALRTNDRAFFSKATDDYLDSGTQVAMLLDALEKTTFHLIGHAISTDYTNDQTNTTSYIVGVWE